MPARRKAVPPLVRRLRERLGHDQDVYIVTVLDNVGRPVSKYGKPCHELSDRAGAKNLWVGGDSALACAKYCIQAYNANDVGVFKLVKVVGKSTPPITEEEV